MSFDINILDETKNPLIDRTELKINISHFGKGGTPNRLEIKKKIAAMQGSKEKLTIVKNIKTHFGSNDDVGKVYIYDNANELKFFEPIYIQVRNMPQEKRTEILKLKKKKEPYKHLFDFE